MSILEILQYPNPRLAKKARTVDVFDAGILKIIDDMLETLRAAENCAGLAATQLDIIDPPRITVIYDYRQGKDPNPEQVLCLVNPEIIDREGDFSEPEGCMSVPGGIYESVARAQKVTVSALDRNGTPFEIEGEGYMAKLLQHELDHLKGIIFIDHVSKLKRQFIDKKISKLQKRAES